MAGFVVPAASGHTYAMRITTRHGNDPGRRCPSRSRRARPASSWLGNNLHAQFLRLKARRGPKKAIMAVAASILTAAYHMLRDGKDYIDLGPDHFVKNDRVKVANRLLKRLGDLGFQVDGVRDRMAA